MEGIEYVPRKLLCKLLYRKEVKGISEYQYNALVEKYDILGKVYRVIEQFYKIVYAKKYEELEAWMGEARLLEIPEVDSYLNGMEKDLIAVKNAIKYKQKDTRQKKRNEGFEWIKSDEEAMYQTGLCKEKGTAFYANHVEEVAEKTEIMNVFEYGYKTRNKHMIRFQWVISLELTKRNLEEMIYAGRGNN